mmetsp:Transcript_63225/g.105221  ORF Transcript_63225/g.105221 Transcript_63225/m.105221 type:complete len:336 (+) Transcript_63225:630-1637(+)
MSCSAMDVNSTFISTAPSPALIRPEEPLPQPLITQLSRLTWALGSISIPAPAASSTLQPSSVSDELREARHPAKPPQSTTQLTSLMQPPGFACTVPSHAPLLRIVTPLISKWSASDWTQKSSVASFSSTTPLPHPMIFIECLFLYRPCTAWVPGPSNTLSPLHTEPRALARSECRVSLVGSVDPVSVGTVGAKLSQLDWSTSLRGVGSALMMCSGNAVPTTWTTAPSVRGCSSGVKTESPCSPPSRYIPFTNSSSEGLSIIFCELTKSSWFFLSSSASASASTRFSERPSNEMERAFGHAFIASASASCRAALADNDASKRFTAVGWSQEAITCS